MFILFPIGRKAELLSIPKITIGLIILNVIIFILAWPSEKHFLNERASYGEFRQLAHNLLDIAVRDGSGLEETVRLRLRDERDSEDFPTDYVRETFRAIQDGKIKVSQKVYYRWGMLYPRYAAFQKSLSRAPDRGHSIYYTYAYSPGGPVFPNIITYQFLHAGILHIFFNMLFLWLVGCNVEERWGPYLFLGLYFFGGAAAAIVQSAVYAGKGEAMVGASGAVAAIMGAFLVRHAFIKIRLFYFLLMFVSFRHGVVEMPAWAVLPLWLAQQLFFGLMTAKYHTQVGYWAHVGGFVFGVAGGLVIRLCGFGRSWEEKAEQSEKACDIKVGQAFNKLYLGELDAADRIFREVAGAMPGHIRSWQGICKVNEKRGMYAQVCSASLRLLQIALSKGDLDLVRGTAGILKAAVHQAELPDSELFRIGSMFDRAEYWNDAVRIYDNLIKKYPGSPFVPKALFAAARILAERLHKHREAVVYFTRLVQPSYASEWGDAAKRQIDALPGETPH